MISVSFGEHGIHPDGPRLRSNIHCTGPCSEASVEDGLDPQTQGNEQESRETHRPRGAGMHETIEERSTRHVKWGACEGSFCGRSRIH